MKKAIYINKATNETYRLSGVRDIEQAWGLYGFVCRKNNWNPAAFTRDVQVRIIEL